MAEFWNRTYKLTLHNKLIEGELHLDFDIVHTRGSEPNTAKITVYNLSPDTRQNLSDVKSPAIILEAGYDERALLFKGKAQKVYSTRSGGDWATEIDCGDGTAEIQRAQTSIGFPEGVKFEQVAEQLVRQSGLAAGNVVDKLKAAARSKGITEFVKGFSFTGNAHKGLTRLAKTVGLNLSVQDEQYRAADAAAGVSDSPAYVLSPSTGLIGYPELGDKGTVRVRSFLLPRVRPDDPIVLESENIKGNFRIEKAQHTGSFRGDPWYTTLDLKQL